MDKKQEKQGISNYEVMKNQMAHAFLQYNQENIIRKFHLKQDDQYLYIRFLEREYRINRLDGSVTWGENGQAADYNEAMTIYDVLCYSKEGCHPAHEWVNLSSLSSIQGGSLSRKGNFFQEAAAFFDKKTQALERACEMLHGRKLTNGDLAYEFDLFPFLPVILRFWESDEEFPESLQILVDRNILYYMHYETVMFAISHLMNRLKALMTSELEQF